MSQRRKPSGSDWMHTGPPGRTRSGHGHAAASVAGIVDGGEENNRDQFRLSAACLLVSDSPGGPSPAGEAAAGNSGVAGSGSGGVAGSGNRGAAPARSAG